MDQHTLASPEITYAPEHPAGTKKIWKVFWILSFITVIELGIGIAIYMIHKGEHPSESLVLALKGAVCILSLAKAFYIVSVFMHLGDEIRNFIMTIIVPLSLFIWFIAAFLWDGSSWRDLRNTFSPTKESTEQVVPVKPEVIKH